MARLISFLAMSCSSQNTDVMIICVRAKKSDLAKNFWGLVVVVAVVVVVVVFVVGGL